MLGVQNAKAVMAATPVRRERSRRHCQGPEPTLTSTRVEIFSTHSSSYKRMYTVTKKQISSAHTNGTLSEGRAVKKNTLNYTEQDRTAVLCRNAVDVNNTCLAVWVSECTCTYKDIFLSYPNAFGLRPNEVRVPPLLVSVVWLQH